MPSSQYVICIQYGAVTDRAEMHGTRSFKQSEGANPTPGEAEGNAFAKFTAECCQALYDNGKESMLESTAPDGRYPKLIDLDRIKRLEEKTGAKATPLYMCA